MIPQLVIAARMFASTETSRRSMGTGYPRGVRGSRVIRVDRRLCSRRVGCLSGCRLKCIRSHPLSGGQRGKPGYFEGPSRTVLCCRRDQSGLFACERVRPQIMQGCCATKRRRSFERIRLGSLIVRTLLSILAGREGETGAAPLVQAARVQ